MDYVLIAVGLLLTVGTGLFVASEFSLVNLDRADLEARRERGESRLQMTIAALKITSTHLSSAQLGITLTTLLTGYTFEAGLSNLLAPLFDALPFDHAVSQTIAVVVSMVIATMLSMVIGELVPKNFALALPRQTAKLVMPFQTAFTRVFRPAIAVLNGSANAVLRALGVEPKEELSGARSAEELSSLVRRSATAGVLEADTATLLNRTLTFSRLTAGDVMTPRPSIHALESTANVTDVLHIARRTGHSRFPVFDEDLDGITGIVHLKAAVSVPRERRDLVEAGAIAEEVLRVPETVHLDALISELRSAGYQMAVVVDEYGGTAGVVTLEDLVEEIVGEVLDEHDRDRAGIVRRLDSVVFPGSLRPDEVLDRTGIAVPAGDVYDTVGGYLMAQLERIPTLGDEVEVPGGTLTVVRMDGRRVDRVKFVARSNDAAATEGGTS